MRLPHAQITSSQAKSPLCVECERSSLRSAERVALWRADEEYMSRSVRRTAAGQASVAASSCPAGGWKVAAKGSSNSRASIKFVHRRSGSSNPLWLHLPCQVAPNPSLKLSPNGVSPSPVWRYAVHFRQSGLGATPPVPA